MSYYDGRILALIIIGMLILGATAGFLLMLLFALNVDLHSQNVNLICVKDDVEVDRTLYVEDAYLMADSLKQIGFECNMDVYGMKRLKNG